jgi:subtilisin family serine protease
MECKLYPHKSRSVVSIQELLQISGWQISAFNLPKTWTYTEGEGVTIGILDTGCDLNHADLIENIEEGFNIIDPSSPPIDDNDHGTALAGAICASNNVIGMVGVAPKAKIVPIKVLDSNGLGYMKNVANGIKYGIKRGVDLMCLSLGSGKPSSYLRKIIKSTNIPLFCAGGNVSKTTDALYPARYPETISIAAMDKNFRRADFSNTAKNNIDFLAPGVEILSTARNGGYSVFSGSSMAVPFGVGVAALLLSAKRKHQLQIKLDTPEDYKLILKSYGVDLSSYNGEKLFAGHGIIQPEKLVEWLRTTP